MTLHSPILITPILAGMYKNHINKTNHMGTGGMVADAFANLIRVMWSESYNFLSPVTFRVSKPTFFVR